MKTKQPINKVVEAVREWEDAESLLRQVNGTAEECRSIPFGIEREQCYINHVFPLIDQLQGLGYSLSWSIENERYDLENGGTGWVHPIIKRR